jgi:TPR repeat protein
MAAFRRNDLEGSFALFERAAAKGHEDSIWILSVVKDVEMNDRKALKEAFAKTEEPLGWYFAGKLSFEREKFDFFKKSAEGGCSWGQVAYGDYFELGEFVEQDEKVYLEWLEKSVNQNDPRAMDWLGDWFCNEVDDKEKAVSYFRAAAELGWKWAMDSLAEMLRDGKGCAKDMRQAVIWSAKGSDLYFFWNLLVEAKEAMESGATDELDCDLNQLCYSLGWGLYWYQYGSKDWNRQGAEAQTFGRRCFDHYCSCVELQQKSIFTFLLFWNRMTGVKGPGQMIAQMVWNGREEKLVETLVEPPRRSARLKRIKQ